MKKKSNTLVSFVEGKAPTKTPKPKSLTPAPKSSKKK